MTLSAIDYRHRLKRTCNLLDGGCLIALSQPEAVRNSTTSHPYRQESFLHYLTGFAEPESALVVASAKPEGEQIHLFLREKDLAQEIWTGLRLGTNQARATLAVDQTYPIEKLWDLLPDLIGPATSIHTAFGMSETYDRALIRAIVSHRQKFGKRISSAHLPIHDARIVSGYLRLQKDEAEISRLKEAALVTQHTFSKIFRTVAPGMNERDVHGMILQEFLTGGAEMEAYPSIVAGGPNAFILHYQDNNRPLYDGELLLIDAGAQKHYYASDVTRTFPVGKRFTPEQRDVYTIVLETQKKAIAAAQIGSNLVKIHDLTISNLTQGLIDLGLLTGSVDENIAQGKFKAFYPHGTSHWIGMDVHDVGMYYREGAPLALDTGMYFSVEPGLYLNPQDQQIPNGFRGICVRIEDDILMTEAGPEVITTKIPKEISDLECRQGS